MAAKKNFKNTNPALQFIGTPSGAYAPSATGRAVGHASKSGQLDATLDSAFNSTQDATLKTTPDSTPDTALALEPLPTSKQVQTKHSNGQSQESIADTIAETSSANNSITGGRKVNIDQEPTHFSSEKSALIAAKNQQNNELQIAVQKVELQGAGHSEVRWLPTSSARYKKPSRAPVYGTTGNCGSRCFGYASRANLRKL